MMNWCGMNELTGRWKLNELWSYGEQLGRGLEFIHSTEAVSAVSPRSRTKWTTASLSCAKTPAKGVTSDSESWLGPSGSRTGNLGDGHSSFSFAHYSTRRVRLSSPWPSCPSLLLSSVSRAHHGRHIFSHA